MNRSGPVPPLVSAEWAVEHLDDTGVRFVDVEFDGSVYAEGHLPGAVCWAWQGDLVDDVHRDLVDREALAALLSRSGIDGTTHVVLYGDDDWFAAAAAWQLQAYGFSRISLLDGGRRYWQAQGLPYETDAVEPEPADVAVPLLDPMTRIRLPELRERLSDPELVVLDVRTAEEYTGAVTAPADYPPLAQRGGHIPGAVWAPWERVLADDGRFRPTDELHQWYSSMGLRDAQEVVPYCGVGVRSSHTWFVLHRLLGYARARNYDGSWAEWGSAIGTPIETGPPAEPLSAG